MPRPLPLEGQAHAGPTAQAQATRSGELGAQEDLAGGQLRDTAADGAADLRRSMQIL